MAIDRNRRVNYLHFTGGAKQYDRGTHGLTNAVRTLLQHAFRDQIIEANPAAMTDNSAGVAGAAIVAIPAITENDLETLTTGALATGVDTAADTVMTAYATILEQLNDTVFALTGLGTVSEGPETGGTGTIAAVDDTIAPNTSDTDAVDFDSMTDIINDLKAAQHFVINATNLARRACGLGDVPVTPSPTEGTVPAEDFTAMVFSTGTAAIANAVVTTATSSGTIASAPLETEIEALLDVFADNIAFLAVKVNEVTDVLHADVVQDVVAS